MAKRSLNPNRIALTEVLIPPLVLVRWRTSFLQFQGRAIARQYRANALGFLWAVMVPLITLGIYDFVFGTVMPGRVEQKAISGADISFTLWLFAGLIPFWLIAQSTAEACGAVVQHTNLVKRAVFPLEIIPLTVVGTAVFHTSINTAILLAATLAIQHSLPVTALLFPLVLLPLLLLLSGITWFLSALGVFFRDLSHIIGLVMTAFLFLSPVFYPVTRLEKAGLGTFVALNPVSFIATESRGVLLEGRMPDWRGLGIYLVAAWVAAALGLLFFRQARRSFADVL